MKRIKELMEQGYKVMFVPVDKEIFQVTIVNTASKEKGYCSRAFHFVDKKDKETLFEDRLSIFVDSMLREIEINEKVTREKYAKPKEETV